MATVPAHSSSDVWIEGATDESIPLHQLQVEDARKAAERMPRLRTAGIRRSSPGSVQHQKPSIRSRDMRTVFCRM